MVDIAPGLIFLLCFGVTAKVIGSQTQWGTPLIFAILFGAIISNSYGIPESLKPGVDSYKLLLEVGIILLGASISVQDMMNGGASIVILVVATVGAGVLLVEFFARYVFGLSGHVPALLAGGSSICGVSAVLAVAGTTNAPKNDIAYATATILMFDVITLAAFPIAGNLLNMSSVSFGVWSGLSMFSTGPVTAAGFAFSHTAGKWATLTKLTRNSLMGPLIVLYSFRYSIDDDQSISLYTFYDNFPKFLIGFFIVAAIANMPSTSTEIVNTMTATSDWFFIFSFVGLGCEIQLQKLRQTGIRPFLTVLVYLLTISVITLFAVQSVF
ncbi:MAG: putative membrane protein [Haloquadratum walsbyi J07HQW2]|uniref:Putative membrane protein n=2 Tax=Haloquadratum walsbyi TaxID=293091 RepID=U1PXC9_9EURY|nr:MAG: putative membrane protein [Haloquadratum walsbyi J07HQW2]